MDVYIYIYTHVFNVVEMVLIKGIYICVTDNALVLFQQNAMSAYIRLTFFFIE